MDAIERTLVLIKPDGVQRSLIGKILTRFEDAGLKIVAMKMVWADKDFATKHYPLDEEWAKQLYKKSKEGYEKSGKKYTRFKDHKDLGDAIQSFLTTFITEGPVVAMVLEGPHSIELVRKMVGSTEPRSAQPGTIRGDFASVESYVVADEKQRAVRNLIHASDSAETAKAEISLWFDEKEIHSYPKDLDKHF
jgi:nucleoside-diphosphate kinase